MFMRAYVCQLNTCARLGCNFEINKIRLELSDCVTCDVQISTEFWIWKENQATKPKQKQTKANVIRENLKHFKNQMVLDILRTQFLFSTLLQLLSLFYLLFSIDFDFVGVNFKYISK